MIIHGQWLILFSHPGDFTPVKSYNLGKYEKAWYCLNFSVSISYITLYLKGTESIVEQLVNRFINNTYDNESYYFYKKYYLSGLKDGIKLQEELK